MDEAHRLKNNQSKVHKFSKFTNIFINFSFFLSLSVFQGSEHVFSQVQIAADRYSTAEQSRGTVPPLELSQQRGLQVSLVCLFVRLFTCLFICLLVSCLLVHLSVCLLVVYLFVCLCTCLLICLLVVCLLVY